MLLLAAALTITTVPAGAVASLDGCPLSQGFWKNHGDLWPTVTLTLNVSAIDETDAEGGWDLQVNTAHPDDHRGNIACRDVALIGGRLTATCEVELGMDAGDWVDLRLVGHVGMAKP